MAEKMTSLITKIKLDTSTEAYTFHNEEVHPTYINFFFGKNGAGKSSIADAFRHPQCLEWEQGKNPANYPILIYDKVFREENFDGYGNLKGVFTLSKGNVEIRKKMAEKTGERDDVGKESSETSTAWDKKKAELNPLLENFRNVCWEGAGEYRKSYPLTQDKRKSRERLTDVVLSGEYAPTDHDNKEIADLYAVAFDPNARKYPLFKTFADIARTYDLSGAGHMEETVTSSSDTDFARFMKALNASEWVRTGHAAYIGHNEGKCPFCQQKLPESFESDIAGAFNESYQTALKELRTFRKQYADKTSELAEIYTANLNAVCPAAEKQIPEYEKQIAVLETCVAENDGLIAVKLSAPAKPVKLKDSDSIIAELDRLAGLINKQIESNNAIVALKPSKQEECIKMVWEKIAFVLKDYTADYLAKKAAIEADVDELEKKATELKGKYKALSKEITGLNAGINRTGDTVKSMNGYLKDSGFEEFSLREKQGVKGSYEVIRSNEKVAENLSEGERNFIAFLYFYHLVRGARSEEESGRNKIVVIDDPVSSMDSSSLFIVSAPVREKIGVCGNVAIPTEEHPEFQGSYIEQIFILTHNAFFHREVTYDQVQNYSYVTLFKINKRNNISTVEPCVRKVVRTYEQDRNYNSVQSSYHALWREYESLDLPIPLMNVIRRILEYYFLQLGGYDSRALRTTVLDLVKKQITDTAGTGVPDYTKYHLAQAMLSYINRADSFNDGMDFADESIDCEQYRDVFRTIFEVMGAERHYKRMMEESNTNI